jgi:hypothetical protein
LLRKTPEAIAALRQLLKLQKQLCGQPHTQQQNPRITVNVSTQSAKSDMLSNLCCINQKTTAEND